MLLVGLGNPGSQYAATRHNVGFMAVQAILHRHFATLNWQEKFKGMYASANMNGEKIHFLLPQTFMNLSGESVRPALDFFKLDVDDVVVIHDELDLELGDIRIKKGGGHAGHNGLKSLIQHLGTPDFRRVRFGIGHPGRKDLVSPYVLGRFMAEEVPAVEQGCDKITKAFPGWLDENWKV